jgi:hypothetical protein
LGFVAVLDSRFCRGLIGGDYFHFWRVLGPLWSAKRAKYRNKSLRVGYHGVFTGIVNTQEHVVGISWKGCFVAPQKMYIYFLQAWGAFVSHFFHWRWVAVNIWEELALLFFFFL